MAVSPGFYCGYGTTLTIETKQNPVMSGPIVEFERASDRCMPNNPKSAKPFTPSNVTHVLSDRDGQMWTHDDLGRLQDFIAKRNDLLATIEAHQKRAKNAFLARDAAQRSLEMHRHERDKSANEGNDAESRVFVLKRQLETLGGAS